MLFALTVSVLAFGTGFELVEAAADPRRYPLFIFGDHRAAGGRRRHSRDACRRHSGRRVACTASVAHVFCDVGCRRLVLLGPASRVPRRSASLLFKRLPCCCRSSSCCIGCGASAPDESFAASLASSAPEVTAIARGVSHDHHSNHRTDVSQTAPAVARRGHRDRCWCSSGSSSRSLCLTPELFGLPLALIGDARGRRRRAGDRRVVAVLQPGALVRAPGRHRPDDRRGGGDSAPSSTSRSRGGNGDACSTSLRPVLEPRPGRLGGGHPSSLRRIRRASMVAAIVLACAPWTLCGRLVSRAALVGIPLAVDADSRATAAGPGRRRARAGCSAASGCRASGRACQAVDARRLATPVDAVASQGRRDAARERLRPQRRHRLKPRRPTRAEGPAMSDRSADASRMAWLSRTRARQRRSRRADRDRLVRSRRRSRCGAGRSDRAGRPSRSTAISSTRRSSAVTTRSSRATG